VVDGVRRSLASGFVFTSHDLPSDLLDSSYGMPAELFALPAAAKAPRWIRSSGRSTCSEPVLSSLGRMAPSQQRQNEVSATLRLGSGEGRRVGSTRW
jgi:hypothetical protein